MLWNLSIDYKLASSSPEFMHPLCGVELGSGCPPRGSISQSHYLQYMWSREFVLEHGMWAEVICTTSRTEPWKTLSQRPFMLLPSLLAPIKFEVLRAGGATEWKKPGISITTWRKVTLCPATSHLTDTLRNELYCTKSLKYCSLLYYSTKTEKTRTI